MMSYIMSDYNDNDKVRSVTHPRLSNKAHLNFMLLYRRTSLSHHTLHQQQSTLNQGYRRISVCLRCPGSSPLFPYPWPPTGQWQILSKRGFWWGLILLPLPHLLLPLFFFMGSHTQLLVWSSSRDWGDPHEIVPKSLLELCIQKGFTGLLTQAIVTIGNPKIPLKSADKICHLLRFTLCCVTEVLCSKNLGLLIQSLPQCWKCSCPGPLIHHLHS